MYCILDSNTGLTTQMLTFVFRQDLDLGVYLYQLSTINNSAEKWNHKFSSNIIITSIDALQKMLLISKY